MIYFYNSKLLEQSTGFFFTRNSTIHHIAFITIIQLFSTFKVFGTNDNLYIAYIRHVNKPYIVYHISSNYYYSKCIWFVWFCLHWLLLPIHPQHFVVCVCVFAQHLQINAICLIYRESNNTEQSVFVCVCVFWAVYIIVELAIAMDRN